MYRLLVVDDEESIRTGIILGNDWNSMGFEVIGSAANGVEAMKLIREHTPDVILTDVKMPVMDGLELIKKVKCEFPDIRCVVLSGYGEFEYVQTALKNKVMDYLLKPTDIKEFALTFHKISSELDAEQSMKYEIEKMRKQVRDSLPLMRDKFLNELVRGCSYDIEKITKKIEYLGLDLDIGHTRVILIEIDNISQDEVQYTEDDKNLLIFSAINIIQQLINGKIKGLCFSGQNEIIIICNSRNSNDALQEIILEMQYCIRKHLKKTISAGIGRLYENVKLLPVSLADAQEALKYKIYTGDESIIFSEDIRDKTEEPIMPDVFEKEMFVNSFYSNNDDLLVESVDRIFARYVDKKFKPLFYIDNLCLDLLFTVIRNIQAHHTGMVNLFTQISYRNIFDCETILARKECLLGKLKELKSLMKEDKGNSLKKVVVDIRDYIDHHYAEYDFSLNRVAEKFRKSTVYVSKLFKAETGENFIDYITRLRIEKAKQLLSGSSSLKVFEVSQMVGYIDVSHFSKLFKKCSGLSPTEYREKTNG